VYPGVLNKSKECIRLNNYIVTMHADEEMDEDELSIFDVETAILSGEIIERQKDTDLGEWKYLVHGQGLDGARIVVIVKFGAKGKLVIITVYRDE
jgi:hypothetical protein